MSNVTTVGWRGSQSPNDDASCKYLVSDPDAKFREQVTKAITSPASQATRPSFRSRWQNGIGNAGLAAAIYP